MNMQNLMAQAQKMQKDIEKKKSEINSKEFIGKSQIVEIIMLGDKTCKLVKINGEIDNDDKEILEDMIKIAYNDAIKQIESEIEKSLGSYGSMLNGIM